MPSHREPAQNPHKLSNRKRRNSQHPAHILKKLKRIIERVDRLPVLDGRSTDEILEYNEYGVPR
jgi:hypothetical protein